MWIVLSHESIVFNCIFFPYILIHTKPCGAGRDGGLAWQGLTSPEVLGATIFAALVPGTVAHLAQAVGQRTVPPSEAQVYS